MTKLVFFTSLPRVGGHTTITLGLVNLLRPSFTDISVIIREMAGHGTSTDAVQQLLELDAKVIQLSGHSALGDFRQLLPFVYRNRKPDTFLAMGMRHFSPALSTMLRPQNSIYYHITHELTPSVVRMLGWYSRFFTKLVFISPATSQNYAKLSNQRSTLAITQPIGELGHSSRSCQGPIRFGFIGRLNKDKGCDVLKEFIDTCPTQCALRIAGAGEYEPTFHKLSATKSKAVDFQFDGPFDSAARKEYLRDFFSSVDYLVVPSQDDREGIPTVILEALQAGVPVLATRTGGMRAFDLPDFGRNSCVALVEKEEIASLMRKVAGQPRRELARECTNYFEQYFSDNALRSQWREALGTNAS